jgi:hypothetical protein
VAIYYAGAIALKSSESASGIALGSKFSRGAELEADRVGMQLAVEAGYNPSAAVALVSELATMSDQKKHTVNEALDRKRAEPGSMMVNSTMRASTAMALTGSNLRTHPDATARLTQLGTFATQFGDAGARPLTPISFAAEIAERDSAWKEGRWRDDPNFAIGYAWKVETGISAKSPPDAVQAAHRRAVAALLEVPSTRRSESVYRNLMIFAAAAGDANGSHNAAVAWWNAGGYAYPNSIDLLIMLGHDDLARQAISIECRNIKPPCPDLDSRKNDLVVATRWGADANTRVGRMLAGMQ